MAYSKTTWVDRNVQYPTRYLVGGVSQTITPNAGTVTNAGTAFSAARMNTIETKLSEVADGTNYYIICGGTANALTATVTGITAYTAGMMLNIKSTAINTGNTTININGLGAKTIARINSSGAINDILPGSLLYGTIIYNGTYFLLLTDHTAHDDRALIDSTGSMLYASSAYTPTKLAIGASGYILKTVGGIPAWGTPSKFVYAASDTTRYSSLTEATTTSTVATGVKNVRLYGRGKFRVTCDLKNSNASYNVSVYVQQIQGGSTVQLGDYTKNAGSTAYSTISLDIGTDFKDYTDANTYCVIAIKTGGGGTAYIRNVYIKYSITEEAEGFI